MSQREIGRRTMLKVAGAAAAAMTRLGGLFGTERTAAQGEGEPPLQSFDARYSENRWIALATPQSDHTLAATDATWKVDAGPPAALVSCIHPAWMSPNQLSPALWIWSQPCTAVDNEVHIFSRTFVVPAWAATVRLDIAVDNAAFITINGQQVGKVEGFSSATALDVSRFINVGSNTISIKVVNYPGCGNFSCNPAGVLARLVAVGNQANTDELSVTTTWGQPKDRPTAVKYIIAEYPKKSIVPVKYAPPNSKVTLKVTASNKGKNVAPADLTNASVTVTVANLLSGKKTAIPLQKVAFDPRGMTEISLDVDPMLKALGARVNRNVLEAQVTVSANRKQGKAVTDNLLHILRQRLILFIPGVCGSEITVASNPHTPAFLALTLDVIPENVPVIGLQAFKWLALDKNGHPTKDSRATKLDLLREWITSRIEATRVYQVGDKPGEQPAVDDPEGHVRLFRELTVRNDKRVQRVQYYVVQAWPYDWRLRLEESLKYLTATRIRPPSGFLKVKPPYESPPTLQEIVEAAQGEQPFMDDKVAIACHSTGGLIARGLLCRERAVATRYVEKVFFIDVPFWGAPKAYFVYLSGSMLPNIADNLMRQIAPNTPIVYYLAPSEQYPDNVVAIGGNPTKRLIRRLPGQRVGDFMDALIHEARLSGDYPLGDNIDPWNVGLEQAAAAYHASLRGEPAIGWGNCHVFWSDSHLNNTPGAVYVDTVEAQIQRDGPRLPRKTYIKYKEIKGDTTVPVRSQMADFPPASLIETPTHPKHVPAPNQPFVWETIIKILAESAGPSSK